MTVVETADVYHVPMMAMMALRTSSRTRADTKLHGEAQLVLPQATTEATDQTGQLNDSMDD